jgi:hypothetical protein
LITINVCDQEVRENAKIVELGYWMFAKISVCLLVLCITACAVSSRGIDVSVGSGNLTQDLASFQVVTEQMPGFLGPIVVSSFSMALSERGLALVSEGGDAVVTLRLDQEQLGENRVRDDFEESVEGNDEVRFMAEIVVEIRAVGGDAVLWQGSIRRLHTARAGDYMHSGPASSALLEAFRAMLKDYPIVDSDSVRL